MKFEMHWDSTCIPLLGYCLMWEISSSWWAQKCSSDLMVVVMASRVALGFNISSGIMVPLSIRVWRAFLSSPSSMSLSCFQSFWVVISMVRFNVWDVQVIDGPGIEDSSVLRLVR